MSWNWNQLARPFLTLAPMEDVTDTVFRQLVRTWSMRVGETPGPAVMMTEFARVDAPIRALTARAQNRPIPHRLIFSAGEWPLVAQIWGTRPEEFEAAARALEQLGFDGIDLNMGCPARKIRKKGACSALIGDPVRAAEIIAACRAGSALPLSVKTRIGLDTPVTERWVSFLLKQQIDALTIHPRTADQMSDGLPDWREVRRAVRLRDEIAPATVMIGNGDVRSCKHAHRLADQTGVDGIMIGRGIFYDPWLFARCGTHRIPEWDTVALVERIAMLREHISAYRAMWDDRKSYEILKKFFRNYLAASRPVEREILERLYTTHSYEAALAVCDEAGAQ